MESSRPIFPRKQTMRIRRPLGTLAGILALAGCGGDPATQIFDDLPEEDRYGGTVVIGSIADISDMNPLTSTDVVASEAQQHVLFLPVIHYDENLEPIPAFARSWEVNADTSLLTFHLRDDVYWHDGVKSTAYDLAFAFERANQPETGFPNTAFWTYYGDGEAVDSFTFQVELRPHAQFMDPWRTFPAVPKHILGDVPPAGIKQHPYSTRETIGNGPFRVASRVAGQSWTFEANPDFPEELGGRPYVDRIVFRWISEPATLLTELITGRVDFYNAPVPPEQAQRVEIDPNVRLITYPGRSFIIIGWNQRREPFGDEGVRRALTMAIDRERIIDAVLYGHGSLANSTVPPFFWQYDAEAGADMGFDPEEAVRLLAEAGFTRGADGIMRNGDGQPLRFTLNTNQGNQARVDIAQIVQADLSRIGIQMNIQVLEWSTLLSRINNPRTRDFDAVMIGWRTEFRIDDSDLFHCDKHEEPYQWVGHCDSRLDALMDTLPLITDESTALPLWAEYQRRVAAQQPYTFIYFEERMHGVHNRLRNVHPDPRGDWVGITRWYLAPGERAPR
jgi:peptide/nickel transport system substrate-binding protein